MLNDPHYQAREVFVDCYDEITQKTVKQVNMIPRFKKHPGKIVRGGAKYDADTQDVLEEFGYSEKEIELLYEKGVLARASSSTADGAVPARSSRGVPPREKRGGTLWRPNDGTDFAYRYGVGDSQVKQGGTMD